MAKISLKPGTNLYPMPITLVAARVNGKPTCMTIAFCGIVQISPPLIAVSCSQGHYTNIGIRENRTFSVNIPSEDMVKVTDYVGLYSGKKVDKSGLFDYFYGELKTAPMIRECPLNLECRLLKQVEIPGTDEMFIGEIMAVYTEDKYLSNGTPDISKIKPIIFSMGDNNYWKLGDLLGPAWSIGKGFQPGKDKTPGRNTKF
jgi:flavin reductase (DIM6/NTAB) family NADH-FMN oxidoreductase RutF